jgi:hypothetical protein
MTDAEFAAMHTWQDAEDREILRGWIDSLKKYSVFFSEPLDLDLAMLAAFPAAYAATIPDGGGPKMAADKAAEAVLGTSGPGLTLYTPDLQGSSTSLFSLSLSLPDSEQAGNASRRPDPPQDQRAQGPHAFRACRRA